MLKLLKVSIKRIIVILMIVTNLFCYLPLDSFAEDNNTNTQNNTENKTENEEKDEDVEDIEEEVDEEKDPALVPLAADSIISKFVSTNISTVSEDSEDSSIADVNDYAEERRWILFSYRSKWKKI